MTNAQQTPLSWGILLGLAVTLAVYFGLVRKGPVQTAPEQQGGFAVSQASCEEIARAVAAYESRHHRRPERLEELVEVQLLREAALHDDRRPAGPPPTFRGKPLHDVVYFPLRRDDAPNLILLCTLVLRDGQPHYHAVTNDGAYHAMTRPELITALNRTYAAIGKDIPFQEVR